MEKTIKFISSLVFLMPYLAYSGGFDASSVATSTLDNGLKIIIKTDRRAPVFISQLWYKVGGSDEAHPTTGISHMLEHMMFQGTRDYKAGEFSRIIVRNGGDENAFTSKDFTAYYQKMHNSKIELAIQLEADRMCHLALSEREFDKERRVVIEERRMRIEDNPISQVSEQLGLISYAPSGAYHSSIIGSMADIEGYKLQDLKDWYARYYAPNNAALVVVGDVNPEQVIQYANTYFSDCPLNKRVKTLKGRPSVALYKQHKKLKLKAELPLYSLLFHVPSLKTAKDKNQAYQLEMLSYVLDNNLSKILVREKQIASSFNTNYHFYDKYRTSFTISFIAAKGIDNEEILDVIRHQINALISNPELLRDELKRIKAQIEANFIFEQDQISTQSYYLGMLEATGVGFDEMFKYVDKMDEITAKQLSNVAKLYLDFEQINTVELIPQGVR